MPTKLDAVQLELIPGARAADMPRTLAPMLPTLVDAPFSHPDWLFEPGLDGIRAISMVRDGQVRLLSRRELDMTSHYPSLARALAEEGRRVVLDGEIVALAEQGRASFHLLQQRIGLTDPSEIRRADVEIPLVYYVFDVLHFDGYDLQAAPLEVRKEILQDVLVPIDLVRSVEYFAEAGEIAYAASVEHGFEGVVAKRRGSRYEAGSGPGTGSRSRPR